MLRRSALILFTLFALNAYAAKAPKSFSSMGWTCSFSVKKLANESVQNMDLVLKHRNCEAVKAQEFSCEVEGALVKIKGKAVSFIAIIVLKPDMIGENYILTIHPSLSWGDISFKTSEYTWEDVAAQTLQDREKRKDFKTGPFQNSLNIAGEEIKVHSCQAQ